MQLNFFTENHALDHQTRFLASRIIASRLRSTSVSVVAHEDTLIRIAVFPCHTVPPHQHVPSA
jgi:hypothetical protein